MSKKYPSNKNVFCKICPECGKEVSSLSKQQFDYNYEQHIQAHKRKLPKSKNMIKDIKNEVSR